MKKILYLLIIVVITTGCDGPKRESFEGVITYATTVKVKDENNRNKDYLEQKFGDTLKVYFNQNGDFYRQIIGSGSKGFDFQLYIQNENNYYAKWKNIDTIYYNSASVNILLDMNYEKGEPETILDTICDSYIITGINPYSDELITQKYFYSGKPYIDSELFEGFDDFKINEYYKKSNSPFMKLYLDLGDIIITYTAVDIEYKKIDPNLFILPKGIPLKE